MISLLLLSMVLLAPASATQPTAVASDPLVDESAAQIFVGPVSPLIVEEQQQAGSFDAMEIRRETDICYKIRAYIFSTGPVPKLLRETTCGPKRPTAKSVEGAKPQLVPIDAGEKSAAAHER